MECASCSLTVSAARYRRQASQDRRAEQGSNSKLTTRSRFSSHLSVPPDPAPSRAGWRTPFGRLKGVLGRRLKGVLGRRLKGVLGRRLKGV